MGQLIAFDQAVSFEEALSTRDNLVWDKLSSIRVRDAIEAWKPTLYTRTAVAYDSSLRQLELHRLLDMDLSLQAFALVNHNAIIDMIKKNLPHAELTRQKFAACYISFTKFLNRRFGRVMPVALPSREKSSKTFFRVREKVATNAVSIAEAEKFIAYVAGRSRRYAIIAKIMLQGAKRIGEVLGVKVSDINWQTGEITFRQQKTNGTLKQTVITFPFGVMSELQQIVPKEGFAFITDNGLVVNKQDVYYFFVRASKRMGLRANITPHVLRATAITEYRRLGCTSDDIMKISGHTTTGAVLAYDKAELSENVSKRYCLIT